MTLSSTQTTFLADREVAYDAFLAGRSAEAYQILLNHLTLDQCAKDFDFVYKRSLPPITPKAGDILSSSWGYDQTRCYFYQVISVTAKSVKLKKIQKAYHGLKSGTAFAGTDHYVTPIAGSANPEAKAFTKRVRHDGSHGQTYSVGISDYETARLWDGVPGHESGDC